MKTNIQFLFDITSCFVWLIFCYVFSVGLDMIYYGILMYYFGSISNEVLMEIHNEKNQKK